MPILRPAGVKLVPERLRKLYEVFEWKHSCAILHNDFPAEWKDILDVLGNFKLCKSHISEGGGSKSKVAASIDSYLCQRGWEEKKFATSVVVDAVPRETPTHKVDCFKNRVALEIEWNNKDPFYDRDLNNFRLLFELGVASVGVIITRCDELESIFKKLGRGGSYGASTTHMSKLLPRIRGGGGGGCPILVFGIRKELYSEKC